MSGVAGVRVGGSLEPHARGFAEELARQGYTSLSAANQLRLLAHLSRWLAAVGLSAGELTADRVEEFLAERCRLGYTAWCSARGLAPLLGYLRGIGVVPSATSPAPVGLVEVLLARYATYLLAERGLAAGTVGNYVSLVRPFLVAMASGDAPGLKGLTGGDVTAFVSARLPLLSRATAGNTVTALRSLLRFLHLDGTTGRRLDGAVPAVAGWRLSGLPRGLCPDEVTALLGSCDPGTVGGRRDLAVLLLLSRLGLRANEVAILRLDDIDWRAGLVTVRGKGNHYDRLPLPVDVGEAIAAHLRSGRPAATTARAVFVGSHAPYRELSREAVTAIVARAADRAGLGRVGPHRLRHTAATVALNAGASMEEVGQLLRHHDSASTAIYAKVDLPRLAGLARAWPDAGGVL